MSEPEAPAVLNLFEEYQNTWTERQRAGFNALPMAMRMAVREVWQHAGTELNSAVVEWEQWFKAHPLSRMDDGDPDPRS